MNPYKEALSSRIRCLTELIDAKTAALHDAPQGTLRISGNGSYSQYYIRLSGDDKNGTYLSVKERDLACALAQKDYDRKILRSAQKELHILLRLQKMQQDCVEEIYSRMCRPRWGYRIYMKSRSASAAGSFILTLPFCI